MGTFYITLISCVILAKIVDSGTKQYDSVLVGTRKNPLMMILYLIIPISLIWFAGLRTTYNDTGAYRENFICFVNVGPIDWSSFTIKHYGGFELYQQLIKTHVNEDPTALMFITAIITTSLYVNYIRKHSDYFCGTMILFLIGPFMFSVAGIKQALAMSIGIYAIDAYYKKKYILMILLFVIAFSFHPYTIVMLVFPFLDKKVWDYKVILIAIGAVAVVANLDGVLGFVSDIGKDYSTDEFTDATINPARVIVQAVPVVISFVFRDKINKEDNLMLKLGTNMNIIGFLFIALGMFVNPMYMGRISTFFTILSMISVPTMLNVAFKDKPNKKMIIIGYYLFMIAYFMLDLTKLGTYGIFANHFCRMKAQKFFDIMFKR